MSLSGEEVLGRALDRGEINLYGDSAAVYEAIYSTGTVPQNKVHSVDRNITNGSEILDVACGTGILVERIDEKYDITGVDISQDMLEVAGDKNPEAELVQGDMRNLPFQNEFDGVVMYGQPVSHLGNYLDADESLRSAYNALNEDGVLVMDFFRPVFDQVESMEPSKERIGEYHVEMTPEFSNYNPATNTTDCTLNFRVEKDGAVTEVDYKHRIQGFSFREIEDMLQEVGFTEAKEQSIYGGDLHQGVRAEKGDPERTDVLGFSF